MSVSVQEFLGHGYLAVDLFFELSGFVIALNYADRFAKWDLKQNFGFFGLRIARVYPLYLFMLIMFVSNPLAIYLFSRQGDVGSRYSVSYFILSLFMAQNWGFTNRLAWNIPAWSISAEWFAYLVFPILAWCSARWLVRASRTLIILATLMALLALSCVFNGRGLGAYIAQFGLLRCLLEFSIGILIYKLRVQLGSASRYAADASLCAVACGLIYAVVAVPDYVVMPLGFAALILALTYPSSFLSRLLDNRPLELVGLISYSTYLVHYFVKDWVKFVLVRPHVPWEFPVGAYIVVTAGMSILLYRWIEVPGRKTLRSIFLQRNKNRSSRLTV